MSKDARTPLWAVVLAALLSLAARYETPNFVVTAPSPQIAEQVGQAAEQYRREIAKEWLGQEMPQWSRACPIKVQLDNGAGGVTSFRFQNGEVFGWNMSVQGPLDQILQSVLPHEVTHTIFASHFRQPLPRWADEGACTTVEHPNERAKQNRMLLQFLQSGRGIGFHNMFRMKEYPRDMLPLYAQGHSLATYLIDQGGRRKFLAYLAEGMKNEERDPTTAWNSATHQYYGFNNLGTLQNTWLDWVRSGSPAREPLDTDVTSIAARPSKPARGQNNVVVRGQSSDPPAAAPSGHLTPVQPVSATIRDDSARRPLPDAESRSDFSADSPGWHPPSRGEAERFFNDVGASETLAAAREPRRLGDDGPSSRYDRTPQPSGSSPVQGRHLPDEQQPPPRPQAPPLVFPAFPSANIPTCAGGT